MAEHVGAWAAAENTSSPENRLGNAGENHRRGQRRVWRAEAEKEMAMRADWPPLLEVAHYRLARVLRRRRHTLATGLASANQDVACSPVDII